MAPAELSHTNVDGLQLARVDAVELARGAVLAGRYEIEATLGRGGAGLVLRAHDRELQEAVAIKVLLPDLGQASRWIERLAREVKLARQLRHPNVCRVFDFEKADGHVFIVMELATRGTLRSELDAGVPKKRPLGARLADAQAVAAGLAAIHDAGIAHRDVTPQNVLRMADGRLVVSDFGLATELSQPTTSIHGGTIAYMAPELIRGQKASFASDVWALGIVIHEIVFGARPTWSKPVGGALLAPTPGRTLSPAERIALDVCRACTEQDAGRRPRTASDVAAWLASGRPTRAVRARRWAKILTGLAIGAAAVVALRVIPRASRTETDTFGFVELANRPADWAQAARVVATIEDRLQCLKPLPDGHTVRFVWGHPARSEDLDLRTGARVPSPLVPEAYREGCTDLSPDGKRLAFQGYTPDGRAFAFVSDHPDGRDAVPLVSIADPSMSSEPKWLPDGRAFSFDIDHQRMGVYSLDTRRTTVLPDATTQAYHSSTRHVLGTRIFISAGLGTPYRSDLIGLGWPLLAEEARFSVPDLALDLASADGNTLFVATAAASSTGALWRVNLERHTRARLAVIPGQKVRYPSFTDAGFAFSSLAISTDVWIRAPGERLSQATRTGNIVRAAPCAQDLIAVRRVDEGMDVVRIDRTGHVLETLASGAEDTDVACSPDGREWYGGRWAEPQGIYRFGPRGRERLLPGAFMGLSMSPDGERLAFIRIRNTEPVVGWVSAKGGEPHEVSASEGACSPGWSSNRHLWVSRRPNGRPAWIEVEADTGKETGKVVAGAKDCADGGEDPASPVNLDVRVVDRMTTQIRLLPTATLTR